MFQLWIGVALAAGAAIAIYAASLYFVNGIEWLGARLGVGQTATGAILAALGTALPETTITLVAVAFRGGSHDIGIGTAMGGPLALSTVGYGAVGLALFGRRRSLTLAVADRQTLRRHQAGFLVAGGLGLGLGAVSFPLKPWAGLALLVGYGLYVWRCLRAEPTEPEGEPGRLKLSWRGRSTRTAAVLQIALSLAVVFVASRLFVEQLGRIGGVLRLPPQPLALLLSPIATEAPEIFNVVIWMRQRKSRLALANISGAMMVQACLPTSLGLFFTPWRLEPSLIAAGAVTLLATGGLWLLFRSGRLSRGLLSALPLIYAAVVVAMLAWTARAP